MNFNTETIKALLGNYQLGARPNGAPDTPEQSHAKVVKILGPENLTLLYKGVTKKPLSPTAGERYVDYVKTVLETHKKSNHKNPIPLEKLLGSRGVKLYKAAIKEERNSIAFRNAVFLKCTKNYPGAKWLKRLILWVGGPSASGKSYGTEAVIQEMHKLMPKVSPTPGTRQPEPGNYVVSIDGGIEREISQIRQITLNAALSLGYKGIKDLHANTELGLKKFVKSAALKTKNLSVVIPNTFANPLFRTRKIKQYEKLENTIQAFSEVIPEKDKNDQFRDAVYVMGNGRAWSNKTNSDPVPDITLNLPSICESKNYNKNYFSNGQEGSAEARKAFLKISKGPYLAIINDLVCVKIENDQWKPCGKEDAGVVVMSKRDLVKWNEYQSNPDQKTPRLNPEAWLKGMKESKQLSPALISLERVPERSLAESLSAVSSASSALARSGSSLTSSIQPNHGMFFGANPTLSGITHPSATRVTTENLPLLQIKDHLEESIASYQPSQPLPWKVEIKNNSLKVSDTGANAVLFNATSTQAHTQFDLKTAITPAIAQVLLSSVTEPIVVNSRSINDIERLSEASAIVNKKIEFDATTEAFIQKNSKQMPNALAILQAQAPEEPTPTTLSTRRGSSQ